MNTAHHRKAIQAFVMAFSYLSSVLSTTDFGCLRLMRRRREAHLYTQSRKGEKSNAFCCKCFMVQSGVPVNFYIIRNKLLFIYQLWNYVKKTTGVFFFKSYLSEYVFMSDLQNLEQITTMKHGMVVNIKASFGVPWTRKYYTMVNHIFLRSPLVHLSNQ